MPEGRPGVPMSTPECFVGIDVSRGALGVGYRPPGPVAHFPDTEAGMAALVAHPTPLRPAPVVPEATGGREAAAAGALALALAGLSVAVINPRQARDFAGASGQLARADALGAGALAHSAQAVRPEARPLPDADARA